MDIKLRARLSAYSKVDACEQPCDIDTVSTQEIDTLFDGQQRPSAITNAEIDNLFESDVDFDNIETVTHAEIDQLFK